VIRLGLEIQERKKKKKERNILIERNKETQEERNPPLGFLFNMFLKPPKNGLIALWPPTNGSIPDF